MTPWYHEVPEGRWTFNALRLLPTGSTSFEGIQGRGYTVCLAGKPIGSLRRHTNAGWMTRIHGFEWRVLPEMGSARFHIKFTRTRLFPTIKEARSSVIHVLASRQILAQAADNPPTPSQEA